MKPEITPERLYNNADMAQVSKLSMLTACHSLISLLEDAKQAETAKPMHACDYALLKAQDEAQQFWRGIIKMITKETK
jgi:hypothetical protein